MGFGPLVPRALCRICSPREREREIERKIERSMIEIYLSLGWEHRTQRKDKTKTESEGRAR